MSSHAGSFMFVMGKERADFAAVSALSLPWILTWPGIQHMIIIFPANLHELYNGYGSTQIMIHRGTFNSWTSCHNSSVQFKSVILAVNSVIIMGSNNLYSTLCSRKISQFLRRGFSRSPTLWWCVSARPAAQTGQFLPIGIILGASRHPKNVLLRMSFGGGRTVWAL